MARGNVHRTCLGRSENVTYFQCPEVLLFSSLPVGLAASSICQRTIKRRRGRVARRRKQRLNLGLASCLSFRVCLANLCRSLGHEVDSPLILNTRLSIHSPWPQTATLTRLRSSIFAVCPADFFDTVFVDKAKYFQVTSSRCPLGPCWLPPIVLLIRTMSTEKIPQRKTSR